MDETERLALMLKLTSEVRDEIVRQHGDLRGTCRLGSQMLIEKLLNHDIHGRIMYGYYRTRHSGKAFHYWVEVDGMILDPTCAQFGGRTLMRVRANTRVYSLG